MIDKIQSYAKKAKDFEIYYMKNYSLNCEVFNNEFDFVSSGLTEGFGIRVANGKQIGLASTNNINDYKKCIDTAIKIANVSQPDENFSGFANPQKSTAVESFDDILLGLDSTDFAKLNKEIISEMQSVNNKINFAQGSISKSHITRQIINSNGVDVKEEFCVNVINLQIVLKGTENVSIDVGSESNKPLNADIGKGFAERLLNLRNREAFKGTKVMPVILHREAWAQFVSECLEPAINAEKVLEKKSPFNEKNGTSIGSSDITIIDDPTKKMFMGSFATDDEGSRGLRTSIIEKGELKGFLHNSYTSKLMDVENTGNASRSISTKPAIGSSNLIMENGRKIDSNLMIRSVMGAHTIDYSSGDFSVSIAEGFYKDKPLRDTMIAGNFYEMIKSLEVGSDQKFCENDCYYLPSVLVDGLTVIGK